MINILYLCLTLTTGLLTGLAGSSSLDSSSEELSSSTGLLVTLLVLFCALVTAGDFWAFLVSTCFFLTTATCSSELELSLSSELSSFFFGTTLGDFVAGVCTYNKHKKA